MSAVFPSLVEKHFPLNFPHFYACVRHHVYDASIFNSPRALALLFSRTSFQFFLLEFSPIHEEEEKSFHFEFFMKTQRKSFFSLLWKLLKNFLFSMTCEENCTKQVTNTLKGVFYVWNFYSSENKAKAEGKTVQKEKASLDENPN